MSLEQDIQELTNEELQTLLLVAFEAAQKGEGRETLRLMAQRVVSRTPLLDGSLFVVVDNQEYFISENRQESSIETVLKKVTTQQKPYIQTAMSKDTPIPLYP